MIDTSGHFCPDQDCSYHGWLGHGNIRANGHPGGQPWRQFQCVSCQGYFYETHGIAGGRLTPLREAESEPAAASGRASTGSATSCKSETGLSQPLILFQVYHNFVLPHASLRLPLAEPIPTNGTGSAKLWQPRTSAMAAGLTDHVWSLREGLLFRVPPWLQPQTV